jgi:hypothetical protein
MVVKKPKVGDLCIVREYCAHGQMDSCLPHTGEHGILTRIDPVGEEDEYARGWEKYWLTFPTGEEDYFYDELIRVVASAKK